MAAGGVWQPTDQCKACKGLPRCLRRLNATKKRKEKRRRMRGHSSDGLQLSAYHQWASSAIMMRCAATKGCDLTKERGLDGLAFCVPIARLVDSHSVFAV